MILFAFNPNTIVYFPPELIGVFTLKESVSSMGWKIRRAKNC